MGILVYQLLRDKSPIDGTCPTPSQTGGSTPLKQLWERFLVRFIWPLVEQKWAAARVHENLGVLWRLQLGLSRADWENATTGTLEAARRLSLDTLRKGASFLVNQLSKAVFPRQVVADAKELIRQAAEAARKAQQAKAFSTASVATSSPSTSAAATSHPTAVPASSSDSAAPAYANADAQGEQKPQHQGGQKPQGGLTYTGVFFLYS